MNKFFALSAVVALMASSANAGIIVNVNQNADPAPGVESYTVSLEATPGTTVSTISGFELTGAHQVWDNALGNGTTPNAGDTEGTFGNPAWTPFDTFILPLPGFNESPELLPVETNDDTNPAGLDLTPENPGFAAFPGSAGIGTLRFTREGQPQDDLASGIAFLNPQPTTVDFLQVVVPAGQPAFLSMVLEDGNTERTVISGLQVGGVVIPEPSSIAIMGLAALGLVGYLRRR